jgi:hypothetical protein
VRGPLCAAAVLLLSCGCQPPPPADHPADTRQSHAEAAAAPKPEPEALAVEQPDLPPAPAKPPEKAPDPPKPAAEDRDKVAARADLLYRRYGKQYVRADNRYVKIPEANRTSDPEIRNLKNFAANWAVGDRVTTLWNPKVFQVLGPQKILLLANPDDSYRKLLMLDRISTDGLTDGAYLKNMSLVIVGTATYGTTTGANKTVLLAVPEEVTSKGLGRVDFDAMLQDENVRDELEARLRYDTNREAEEERRKEKEQKAFEERMRKADEERREAARQKAERQAGLNLDYVKKLLKRDETGKARKRLQEVVKEYPGTEAAKEAAKMLEELKKAPPVEP